MTIKDYLNIFVPVLVGLLGIALTGWWQIRALTKKFNMEGGTQKTKGELEIQNIEIATRASAYALSLQKTIDSQADIMQTQDERIEFLEKELARVNSELEMEREKNRMQDAEIQDLQKAVKRNRPTHLKGVD